MATGCTWYRVDVLQATRPVGVVGEVELIESEHRLVLEIIDDHRLRSTAAIVVVGAVTTRCVAAVVVAGIVGGVVVGGGVLGRHNVMAGIGVRRSRRSWQRRVVLGRIHGTRGRSDGVELHQLLLTLAQLLVLHGIIGMAQLTIVWFIVDFIRPLLLLLVALLLASALPGSRGLLEMSGDRVVVDVVDVLALLAWWLLLLLVVL